MGVGAGVAVGVGMGVNVGILEIARFTLASTVASISGVDGFSAQASIKATNTAKRTIDIPATNRIWHYNGGR